MVRIRRLTAQNFKQLREVELVLPRRGRFLVQGANESGKSTLFEAVYFGLFGKPLVTETAALRLDDLIHYGAEAAWVALELELPGERIMAITRHVRRGKANQWSLTLTGADGRIEELKSNAGVNERVAAELGFDGEALLNTCFVEQKKLEKLEGLAKRDREQSLKRLLNLDRLVVLEDELKVKPDERANVQRLHLRLELAENRAKLPGLQGRLAAISEAIGRHEVHAGLQEVTAGLLTVATLAGRLDAARGHEAALAERVTLSEQARQGMARVAEARTAFERAAEAATEQQRYAEALAMAVAARDEHLPAVMVRGQALTRLKRRLACLAARDAEQQSAAAAVLAADMRLKQAAEERATLNQVRQNLVAARATQRDATADSEVLAGDVKAFAVRRALADWVAAEQAVAASVDPQLALADAAADQARHTRGARRQLIASAAVGMVLLVLFRFLLPDTAAAWGWLAVIGLLGLLAWLGVRVMRQERVAAETVGRLRGEATVYEQSRVALAARSTEAAQRLASLNVVRPADGQRAELVLAELDARLAGRSETDVAEALEAARHAAIEAGTQVKALELRETELRAATGHFDAAALGHERDALAQRAERLAAFLARRSPMADDLARTLGVTAEAGAIEGELGALRSDVKTLRAEVEQLPGLAEAVAARASAEAGYRAALATAWSALPVLADQPAWPTEPDSGAIAEAAAILGAVYEQAGGDALRREADAANRAAAQLAGEHGAAERAVAGRYAAVVALAGRLKLAIGLAPQVEPDVAAVDQAAVSLAATLEGDPQALAQTRETVASELNVTRHEVDRLERQLGLAGVALDVDSESAAWREAERTLAVRERAVDLVSQAGRNVVQRVMPSTIEHMRRLLPSLTDGRYFDADLTEDYRIKVLDERAGDWKQKNIFSGGTKDQFSLALRLAFAIATLPEERGSAPSFLFLDEPLGAFDDNRARALVELLTAGEVADSFDQIFLISHVRVDEALFDYQITLVDGRVVDSNLPVAASSQPALTAAS